MTRKQEITSLDNSISHAMKRVDRLGFVLEVFDNKKHVHDKISYAADLRAYFMAKLVSKDMKTIE